MKWILLISVVAHSIELSFCIGPSFSMPGAPQVDTNQFKAPDTSSQLNNRVPGNLQAGQSDPSQYVNAQDPNQSGVNATDDNNSTASGGSDEEQTNKELDGEAFLADLEHFFNVDLFGGLIQLAAIYTSEVDKAVKGVEEATLNSSSTSIAHSQKLQLLSLLTVSVINSIEVALEGFHEVMPNWGLHIRKQFNGAMYTLQSNSKALAWKIYKKARYVSSADRIK